MLRPAEPFFFKLKAPRNAIGGYGFFVRTDVLPLWRAWEVFGTANGVPDQAALLRRVNANRSDVARLDSRLGCISLIGCRFFTSSEFVTVPRDWSRSIVSGKTYDLTGGEGLRLWQACQEREAGSTVEHVRFGRPQVIRPRLGQGSFQLAVHEAYGKACAVTGEHSLPVLEAAHIKPYAIGGQHDVSNGLPLRRDLHRLFDLGYVSVRPDLTLMVSDRLRLEYDNGKAYYDMAGQPLRVPTRTEHRPDEAHLEWHRDTVYRAG